MIEIVPYDEKYELGIHEMLVSIEGEFEHPIRNLSKNTKKALPNEYWIALKGKEVIGTVGLLFIRPQNAILKSMMIRKDFRGKAQGLSYLLLQKAMDCCLKNEIETLYLGTMWQFKAAQKFYQKNGFKEIQEKELPKNFLGNPLDKIFFYKKIKETK
jgi:N-acetylglutamate synthase-like GNAT family acetyltransferase